MIEVIQINQNGSTLWKTSFIEDPFQIMNDLSGATTNTCTLTKNGAAPDINLEYSFDNSNWTTWAADASGNRTISIPANGKLYLRGDNPNGFCPNNNDADYYTFNCTGNYQVGGDVRSLISHYASDKTPSSAFRRLFYGSTTLKKANLLKLYAKKPGKWAYLHLFNGCTGLTLAPHELPATNVVNDNNDDGRCYGYMFKDCTSLVTMPKIKATMFGFQTCYEMFRGCTSLTNQWASDAIGDNTTTNISFTITSGNNQTHCFYAMFQNCTSLIDASGITATKTAWNTAECQYMFYGCSALTSAPSITFGSFAGTGSQCHSMFRDCTSLVSTPNIHLDATTVLAATYKSMFRGCTKLTTAPEIKATSMDNDGSTDNGSLAAMFYGCSALTYIKVNFTSWNSGNYTKQWTQGVSSSGRFDCPSGLASTYNTEGFNTYGDTSYIPHKWGKNQYSSWNCTNVYLYKSTSNSYELVRFTVKKWNGSYPSSGSVGGNRTYSSEASNYPSSLPSDPSATASQNVNASGQIFFNIGTAYSGTRYYIVKFRMATKDSSSNADTIWTFYKKVTN